MTQYSANSVTVSAQANPGVAKVKPQSGGRSQNGQPVDSGQPLFIIG